MEKNNLKIAIVLNSLKSGGAERFGSQLSKMLTNSGYEVFVIVITDNIDYAFSGKLFNVEKQSINSFKLIKKVSKAILIRKYLKENKINLVIDNKPRNWFLRDFIFNKLIYKGFEKIYIVQNYNTKNYIPVNVSLAKFLYNDAKKIVCVANEIEDKLKKIYHFSNLITIHNTFDAQNNSIEIKKPKHLPEKYLLFFGRLEEQSKNFSLMLQAFQQSRIIDENFKLVLLGNGPDLDLLKKKVESLQLNDSVLFIPYVPNPHEYVKFARFSVLTSHYEGFPLAILESLSLGIPVVAVDCKSGPSEVIIDKKNGLLVPNYNQNLLAKAFRQMALDDGLYTTCSQNATDSVAQFSTKSIQNVWDQLITNIYLK